MARVVIIGAGLTGLSAAYYLEQSNFFDYVVYEQNDEIGGLCRSVRQDGFTFDYTGHFFHGTNPDVLTMLGATLGHHNCRNYLRRSSIFSHGVYTAYPYQSNLHGLPKSVIIECIEEFFARPQLESALTFESWVMKYFGSGFARHFFFPYQEKIFDFPISQLTSSWVGSIPRTTFSEILEGALEKRDVHSVGYNAHFVYPQRGGIDHLVKGIAQPLKNKICTKRKVVAIDSRAKTVTFNNGSIEPYEFLITTMPMDHLLACTKHGISNPYEYQAGKLLCNTVVNINIGIEAADKLNCQWVYYPEKQFPFFRVGFPHTLHNMAPAGYMSISAEIAILKNRDQANIDTVVKNAIRDLSKIFKFSVAAIRAQHVLTLKHAYVIYDAWREKNIQAIHERLNKQLIFSVGRYGAWRYSSMQDDIIDGCSVARTILSMVQKDISVLNVAQQRNSLKEIR